MLTIRCAEALRLQDGTRINDNGVDRTAKRIMVFLRPFLPAIQKDSTSERGDALVAEVENNVSELCKKALNLTLLLRGSKTTYRCETFHKGISVDDSDGSAMVAQAWDGPQTDLCDAKVAFTLFGALVKIRHLASDERYILERGHVVCEK
jgi:hypothetical protein